MPDIDWSAVREEALRPLTLTELPPSIALPAFPHAVTRFIERSKDDSASIQQLAAIVETDAGLTIELLKHVNSSFVGLRAKARTVQQALSLLGIRQSKMLLITTGMQAAVLARKSKLINQACFWNACLQKAIFARLVAKMLKADADVAFAGALLQDYLLPVLTNDLFDEYTGFIESRATQPESLCDFERPHFGWDHATAAALLAHRWKLPDDLVCCLLFHHRGLHALADRQLGRTAVAAVALSALLPDQLRQQYNGLEQLLLLQEKWPAFQLGELVEQADREHAEMGMGVNNDFPLARRCKAALEGRAAEHLLSAAS